MSANGESIARDTPSTKIKDELTRDWTAQAIAKEQKQTLIKLFTQLFTLIDFNLTCFIMLYLLQAMLIQDLVESCFI